MSNFPSDLKYTKDHEWAKKTGATVTVGVDHHAQDALGSIVYVELPKTGTTVKAGEKFAVIESTKAVSEVFAPVSGKIVKVNDAVSANPGAVNEDCYGAWLIELEPSSAGEWDALMDQATYVKQLEAAK